MNPSAFLSFMEKHFATIDGWCNRDLVRTASIINQIQSIYGIQGGAGEIGVHHGKFFIPLSLLKADQRNVAIDVFDLQQFNLDRSGKGSKTAFLENVGRYSTTTGLKVIEADSLRLGAREVQNILSEVGPLSMFSVDGCHTVEHTLSDLLVAEQLVGTGGVIFVDDYYNPNWPGVQEAVNRYYASHAYRFVPLCFAFTKLILVDLSFHHRFMDRLEPRVRGVDGWACKKVKRFGYENFSLIRKA